MASSIISSPRTDTEEVCATIPACSVCHNITNIPLFFCISCFPLLPSPLISGICFYSLFREEKGVYLQLASVARSIFDTLRCDLIRSGWR